MASKDRPATPSVATLVSSPATPLSALLIAEIGALVDVEDAQVLAPGRAADLLFKSAEPQAEITERLRAKLEKAGAPVDVIVQPRRGRRKRLFLADMDSTMIGQECIDELADFAGLKPQVSEITERAMRGELAFEPALRERVGLLKGLSLKVVDEVIAERLTLTPGGRELVMTMRAHGARTCLVSGGFTVFTGPISEQVGFHEHHSNTLLVADGQLTGEVAEPILGREAKLATLLRLRDELGLEPGDTMAVGDGANDLAMLEEAGLGIAYHAKPAVAAAAHARIEHGDLSALLYAQGFRIDEFVS